MDVPCAKLLLVSQKLIKFGRAENLRLCVTDVCNNNNKRKCENYRGISVTSTFSRIYGRILAKFVELEYKNMEMEEKSGFRTGRSCIDINVCITQMTEKKKKATIIY